VAAGRVPVSTYRLQLTPEFGFAEASEVGEYLACLGVTHVYLSPVLEAVPGSRHGYDVTDHSRIRTELGGEDGFRAMASRFRSHGLGIVLDIVPNHMAVPAPETLNRQLWSVLRDGPGSPYATWFDIDWAAQDDRMVLPILAGPLQDCLGDLAVDRDGGPDGEPVLRYFDHVLPLRQGTERLPLPGLLKAQHYRLTWWRNAGTELNWRRFFNITSLIAVRSDDPAVFDATHAVILRLVSDGLVDGLRVDHLDGLADPRGYLRRLASVTGGAWVVVEKILEATERLPDDWPCAGTTGYDGLRLVDGLFIDSAGGAALGAEYAGFARQADAGHVPARFAEVAEEARREVATGALRADVTRLAAVLADVCPEATPADARSVLTEILACFSVYRAYVNPGEPPPAASVSAVRDAVDAAGPRLPPRLRGLAAQVGAAVLGTRRPASGEAGAVGVTGRAAELIVRFQQTTGPVQAKGMEDTAFYRWPRLTSLNEVGGDPDRFGVRTEEFHAASGRLASDWPATMTTLSTHDSKRQEDVRARLAVLAEMPGEWGRRAGEWHERATSARPSGAIGSSGAAGAAGTAVDPDTEYLQWQTLVGAWPVSGERLTGYLTKAIREAKQRTSWADPDPDYESAVLGLAARALDDQELAASIQAFVASISADALVNSLGAKLVQLTMPGVADLYQGCELAGLSMVDPDNRRDVGFARRRRMLADLDAGRLDAGRLEAGRLDPDGPADAVARLDAAKLLVTARALRLRRDHPDWFAGSYTPLTAAGSAASHVVAFARGGRAITMATRLPVGLRRRGGWADTALPLPAKLPIPAKGWLDVLTGSRYSGQWVPLSELTRRLPVALLAPEE
jgi:(1->4)-alpha-D-glucan 1-alpha-D-glucosylmutase